MLFVVRHRIQINQMWVLPCGPLLPLHPHHFKHTIWDKEKLPLIPTVGSCNIIDMQAFVLGVDVDDIDDRGKVAVILGTGTESASAVLIVSGGGQEHGHMVHLAHIEEESMLLWQTPPSIENEVMRPWNSIGPKLTSD